MRVVLDHVGIAVRDVREALAFYRDALGLEIEASEDVASQHVRAHFLPVGPSEADPGRGSGGGRVSLELLESTAPDSAIAKYVEKRGPGLHHITLRVDDLPAALAVLKAHGARLVDEGPRQGAEGARVAFVHPSSAHGVLVELKQSAPVARDEGDRTARRHGRGLTQRFLLGDLELISVTDGFFRLDGGAMFGVVPKVLWGKRTVADESNRILLGLRPLVVRGARTLIIDAGIGDKEAREGQQKFIDQYGVDRTRSLDDSLAEAGLAPEDIDIVLATHLHFDHAGGFTVRDGAGRLRPRFPRARYVVRRGEWLDATHPNERNRASYLADNFLPLEESGVLELVDDDQTIMPGVTVRRTGGHTMHHQMVLIESGGRTAAFVADMMPTTAHVPEPWIMGYDLHPLDTLAAKKAFLRDAVDRGVLVFFEHDPETAAGYVVERDGRRRVEAAGS
jgi:methylmalonyl-CoA epimerase